MRLKKTNMREIRDMAAIERAVAMLGDIALSEAAKHAAQVPGNKPRYYRGALIKSRSNDTNGE